ncbi:hypothetical protein A2415_02775 [candidate division WWE3 bacterium RIFOXYC1_FULL_39_7]|uniref:Glycosyltransferase RgtA/B/C/D-like domain-containing protein n=1 Tax=candidate division WWE3 bacterium RIFOXYC1_FULL_39_7 TaxID=1802643 RepID=A0A1F4WFH9_UNCKA|nr:MAG: hypothetical protein A2415_02775 [candidate division WWE3 bacterium RIFOXYC1_FULL_39_7]
MKKLIISLILSILICRLPFIDIKTQIVGEVGDIYQFMFLMDVSGDNLSHGNYLFSSSNRMRYPLGFDFTSTSDGALAIITGAFLCRVFPIVVSYNLTISFIVFLNLFLSLVFFEKINKLLNLRATSLAIYSSTIVFALSPYVIARTNGHPSLAFIAGFPVLTYAVIALYKKLASSQKLGKEEYITFYAGLLLISYGSIQYLIAIAWLVLLVMGGTYAYTFFSKRKVVFTGIPFLISFVFDRPLFNFSLFVAAALLFIYPYKGYLTTLMFKRVTLPPFSIFPTVYDLFIPNGYLGKFWSYINPSPVQIETVATVGFVEVILLGFLIYKTNVAWIKKTFIAGIFIYILFALHILSLPLYSEGSRLVVFLSLGLSLLILFSDSFMNKKFAATMLLLLVLERFTFAVYATDVPSKFIEDVKETPGETVLVLPFTVKDPVRNSIATFTDKKLYDGYFHRVANTPEYFEHVYNSPFENFTCSFDDIYLIYPVKPNPTDPLTLIEDLKEAEVQTIVVFKKNVINIYMPECSRALENFESVSGMLTRVAESPAYDVYIIN